MSLCPSRPKSVSALRPYFQKGCVRIFHGDCIEVLRKLGNQWFDWILTDPPYGTNQGKSSTGYGRQQNYGNNGAGREIKGDDNLNIFKEMFSYTKSENICTFAHPKKLSEVIGIFNGFGAAYYAEFIWNKKTAGLGRIRYSHETILIATLAQIEIKAQKTVFDAIAPARKNSHPHEKPLSVIGSLLEILKPESVIDPFLGSGTTAVACLERGIPMVGIEIDEQWAELAAHRLSQDILL